jgi:hypothetical protein
MCADPTRIRQILIILVDNAIKFTPANGAVKVQARVFDKDPSLVVLEVSDSGCGISPDMTERIFERLFQTSDPSLGRSQRPWLGACTSAKTWLPDRGANLDKERARTRVSLFRRLADFLPAEPDFAGIS